MDEVEGIGVANVEIWTNIFTGASLSYTVSTGLTSNMQYNFRLSSVSEYSKQSLYSDIGTYYASSLPDAITFPTSPFSNFALTEMQLGWN